MNPYFDRMNAGSPGSFAGAAPDNADAAGASGVRSRDDGYHGIRITIWLYFWLLIFEGALRKWVFPGSSNTLLLVRDPVVAICYFLAIRNNKFPTGPFVLVALFLGILSFMASLVVSPVSDVRKLLLITGFGFHANFLHLPMIFLIRDAFDWERIRAIGKWTLLLAPLTAVLVFLQYRSPSDAWVNHGAGKDSAQIAAGVHGSEKIRPAGLFSYNTGNSSYLAWVTAFLLNGLLIKKGITRGMVIVAAMSLVTAGSLSVSRTCILSIALVVAGGALCSVLAPKLATRSILVVFLIGCLYFGIAQFSVLGEGVAILQARVEESGGFNEGGIMRIFGAFVEPFLVLDQAGILGTGLGMGTNVAGSLMTGERTFLLTENEWSRHILESGVILGFAFIFWRLTLLVHLLRVSLKALKALNPLPMLIFSSCFVLVLNAPMGIPMTLGFVVMGAGMTLAAAKESTVEEPGGMLLMGAQATGLARGRSAYAERLHSGQRL